MENVFLGAAILLGDMMTVHIHLVLSVLMLFRWMLVRSTNSWGTELLVGLLCLGFFLCKHSSVQELCTALFSDMNLRNYQLQR